jgi:transcriptional regulator with XRE-family HTH domain
MGMKMPDDPRFRYIGLSSDGLVIFCALDNGNTYAMPLGALDRAEDWDPEAKPKTTGISHDGYAAFVQFDTGVQIDFPADFVLHVCEPSYGHYKGKARAGSAIGARIREIRQARRLTLDALAAKSGIAKPNLSRIEHGKVTPTFETLRTLAAALDTHPVLLSATKKPAYAWAWTREAFEQWRLGLIWHEAANGSRIELVRGVDLVKVFLATRPEHRYARVKLLQHANHAPHDKESNKHLLDAERWGREMGAERAARLGAKGR